MPLPSEADLQAAIGKAVMMDKELFAYLAQTGTHWITREAAYLAAVPADAQPAAQQAQAQLRAMLANATQMLPARCAALWDTYARVAALRPNADYWDELRRYFVANSLKVKSRGFSFGSWSAVTGSGTGAIYRLTVDQDGYVIESGFGELKTAECIRDQANGAPRHSEVFRIRGAAAGKDALELIGTGKYVDITCLSPASSGQIVKNPSFEAVTETTYPAISAISNWTASSIANLQTETSDYYRDNPQASTSRSLRFLTNASILQSFTSLGLAWDPRVPLFARIAFKRESSCDGNLNIIIGNVTTTVALSAQSGWTILTFSISLSAWYLAWKKAAASGSLTDAAVKISLDSRTTGTLLIDDFIIGPYTQVNGAWVAIVGGATPFLLRDVFTVTDTANDVGVLQTIFARRYGQYLPHHASTVTWADPT